MKRNVFKLTLLYLILIAGCTDKETKPLSFDGDIQFKLSTYTEFGYPVNDKENIEIKIEGTDPEIKGLTDTAGIYLVEKLKMGTYNLHFFKEGYGARTIKGQSFIGSDKPRIYSMPLYKKSSTTIKDYSLSISGNKLTISGEITHQYPKSRMINYPYNWPFLVIYYSTSPDVSSKNYQGSYQVYSNKDNDLLFNVTFTLYSQSFVPGNKVYTILYGKTQYASQYLDPETNLLIDPTHGQASEIKSITIP